MVLGCDDLSHVWVPQHQVGIGAHSDAAFAGEQVEDLGCVCASHRHKLVLIHFTSHLLGQENISNATIYILHPKFHKVIRLMESLWNMRKVGHIQLTTHLSQIRDILSSVPLVPSGIKVKLSLPIAR